MEPDYKFIRKQIPPKDYEIKDKKRYDRSDRYSKKKIIDEELEEYYRDVEWGIN